MRRFVLGMAALCLICLCVSGIRTQSQQVLRGKEDSRADDETYVAAMRLIMTGQLGDEVGNDFVNTLVEFDKALEDQVAGAADAQSQEALQIAKQQYDQNMMSWSKMKNELSTSSLVRVNAAKAGILGLKSSVAAIKKGEPVAAVAAVLEAIGGVAIAIPGGQGFGLAFSLVGAVTGMFAPAAKPSKALTLDGITSAVKSAMKEELDRFASKGTAAEIHVQCNAIREDISSVYQDINYWSGTDVDQNTIQSQLLNGLSKVKELITDVAKVFAKIDTTIDQNVLVNTDPTQAGCADACALMTVQYDRWVVNPSKIDYDNPKPSMNDNADSSWKWGDKAYWRPCSGKFTPVTDQMRTAAYKACIAHGLTKNELDICAMDKGCAGRVDNINGCRENLDTSKEKFRAFEGVYECAKTRTMQVMTLLSNIRALGAVHNNFPSLNENFKLLLGNLDAQSQRLTFYLTYRDPKLAKIFSFGGKEYDCDDPERKWVEAYGIKSFSDKAPWDDVPNTYLSNGPCSTERWIKWQETGSTPSAYRENKFECTKIENNGPEPNWEQPNPFYDYKALTKTKWQDKFILT